MALADDLTALRNIRPRTFKQWLEWADPADVKLVLAALSDTSITPNSLAATLTKNGIPITRDTIEKYRDARG